MKRYEYVVNTDIENCMFNIVLVKNGATVDKGYFVKSVGYSMEIGTLTLTGSCPVDLEAGKYTMIVQYVAEDGSVTSLGSTKWDDVIDAGSDFTIKLELPKQMFTITVVPVKKSIIKTVYNYITKFRRK
jgi:hypothetical protein